MSYTWPIIAIVAVAAAGMLLMLYRKNQVVESVLHHNARSDAPRDFARDREDARLAHMSADDRDWETATLRRQQENSARGDTLAEQRT